MTPRNLAAEASLAFLVACSGAPVPSTAPASIAVSLAPAVRGVPDRGMDPTVVAIAVEAEGFCSGVLVASDVVLTARHCTAVVAANAGCPAVGPQIMSERNPATLSVLAGDDVGSAVPVASGLDVFVPDTDVLCGADIALILLDRPITTVTPAVVQGVGEAKGQHVRSVGYWGEPAQKRLREHVPVLSVTPTELAIGEAPCLGLGGDVAFDEATGHVVGVLGRFGPCGAKEPYDVYTRADVYYELVQQAWASSVDSGKKQSTTDHRDPTDIGAACFSGSACGAGVCIDTGGSEYCSQQCAATDKCPTDYKCDLVANVEVCVASY